MGFFSREPVPPFEPVPLIDDFLNSPLKFLLRQLYFFLLWARGPSYEPEEEKSKIRVVAVSDSHCKKVFVPDGDLLIHAGDMAEDGTAAEIQDQIDWLKTFPHRHKVVICGNHDGYLDERCRRKEDANRKIDWGDIHYLEHSAVTLTFPSHNDRSLRIYGAPQIPKCGGSEFAFQYQRHEDAWTGTIPQDIDILITHTPPKYHLDLPTALGCQFLLREVWKIRPTLHVFGHVHAGYGSERVFWDGCQAAFERVSARKSEGVVADMINVGAFFDGLKMLFFGLQGILWNRVWGGKPRGGIMVNAALSVGSTGRLGNPPHMIDL